MEHEQEIAMVKNRLNGIIDNQIEASKVQLQILRTYEKKLDTFKEDILKEVFNDFVVMFNLKDTILDKDKAKEVLNTKMEELQRKIQAFKTIRSQSEAAQDINELKKIHDDVAELLGL